MKKRLLVIFASLLFTVYLGTGINLPTVVSGQSDDDITGPKATQPVINEQS